MCVGYVKGIIEVTYQKLDSDKAACDRKKYSIIPDYTEILPKNSVCNFSCVVLRDGNDSNPIAFKIGELGKIDCSCKDEAIVSVAIEAAMQKRSMYWQLQVCCQYSSKCTPVIVGYKIAND